jgi:hypothetical protein
MYILRCGAGIINDVNRGGVHYIEGHQIYQAYEAISRLIQEIRFADHKEYTIC